MSSHNNCQTNHRLKLGYWLIILSFCVFTSQLRLLWSFCGGYDPQFLRKKHSKIVVAECLSWKNHHHAGVPRISQELPENCALQDWISWFRSSQWIPSSIRSIQCNIVQSIFGYALCSQQFPAIPLIGEVLKNSQEGSSQMQHLRWFARRLWLGWGLPKMSLAPFDGVISVNCNSQHGITWSFHYRGSNGFRQVV